MSDIEQMVAPLQPGIARAPVPDLIAKTIREDILSGKLRRGERLPAEPELATRLQVSRASVRQALSLLVFEGLLVRQHGLGTFVTAAPREVLHGGLAELTSTTELIRRHGYEPGTRGFRVEEQHVDPEIARACRRDPTDRFVHVSRTRLANGQPVVHCEEFVPVDLVNRGLQLPKGRVRDWSLYRALGQAGMAPTRASCTVIPIIADEEIADKLSLSPGTPLLLLKQVHYTQEGQPVLYCENWHNSSILELQIVRKL